jgi:hypothetical protein
VPKKGQGNNLLVPVAMSASHIAYGSIRMEPVFMILGQSAATAAVMAIDEKCVVQDVPYSELRQRLLDDGQILNYSGPKSAKGVDMKSLKGIVLDDSQAKQTGHWSESGAAKKFIGDGYAHDGNANKGTMSLTFSVALPKPGKYEVRLAYTPNNNRATNVPVMIKHAGGEAKVTVNERQPAPVNELFVSLGSFEFGSETTVTISNEGADGYVVVDALQIIEAN